MLYPDALLFISDASSSVADAMFIRLMARPRYAESATAHDRSIL